MKNKWLLGLVSLLLLAPVTLSQAQQMSGRVEQGVAALEMQWLKSDQTNNADLAAPLLADGYAATTSEGKLEDKAQTLADYKNRKYASASYDDLKVTVFGNTAIARGTYRGTGTDSGKPFDEHFHWTDTWVKMPNGKWQCVATHYSKV